MAPGINPDTLTKHPLFEGLDSGALAEVAAAMRTRKLLKNAIVFEQGENAETCYLVLEGRVKLAQVTADGQQVTLRLMGPGEMVGGVAAFNGFPYPGTASAVMDTVVAGLDSAALNRLVQRYPRLSVNVNAMLGSRLQEMQSRFRELATEKVERRVARAILRLARHAGRKVDAGVEIEFPISRQDIAEMTGTTLHTVSRILSAWEQQGMIDGGRQHIVIRAPHKLVAIAEDL